MSRKKFRLFFHSFRRRMYASIAAQEPASQRTVAAAHAAMNTQNFPLLSMIHIYLALLASRIFSRFSRATSALILCRAAFRAAATIFATVSPFR